MVIKFINEHQSMTRDYQFLIGQRFSVAGEIYVVRDLTSAEDQTYVEVLASESGMEEESSVSRTFTLSDVVQWLLVDEEIELFNPNFLAAR